MLTYGYVFKEKYICTMRLRAYNISELQYSEMTDETAEDAPPAGLVTASSKCLFEFYLKPKPAGVQPLHLLICPHEWREEQGTTLGSQVWNVLWNVLTSVWARRRLGPVYSCGHYSTHRQTCLNLNVAKTAINEDRLNLWGVGGSKGRQRSSFS